MGPQPALNKVILERDLTLTTVFPTMRWPLSDLEVFTAINSGQMFTEIWTLPTEWRDTILTNWYHGGGVDRSDTYGGGAHNYFGSGGG